MQKYEQKYDLTDFVPFRAVHVGEFLKEELKARGMKKGELVALTGIALPIIDGIIKCERDITEEQSMLIGKALNIDTTFFYDMQKEYERNKVRITQRTAEQTKTKEMWNIITQYVSISFFESVKIVTREKEDIKENIKNIFTVFGVSTIDEFLQIQSEHVASYYKKSEKLTTDEVELFSWTYYCKYVAKNIQLSADFDKAKIDDLCGELNNIFADNNNVIENIKEVCANYGIKFFVVPKKGQMAVDGISFKDDDNPTIVLTLRRKNIDNFAFTFMHELGHVCLHINDKNKMFVNIEGVEDNTNTYEKDADNFAQEKLIPSEKWKQFKKETNKVLPYRIAPYVESFATTNKINPTIVMGRYKYETQQFKIRSSFIQEIK